MTENKYNPEGKGILFIDSNYNELFRVPDGGRIVVTRPEGEIYPGVQEEWVGDCRYLDGTHVEINGECYHICQFAELQERIGAVVEPEVEPEMVGGHYRVTRRAYVGGKVFKLGESPGAPSPYATWQGYRDSPRCDWGHYWQDRQSAAADLLRRQESERLGIPYDHTKPYRRGKDSGAR